MSRIRHWGRMPACRRCDSSPSMPVPTPAIGPASPRRSGRQIPMSPSCTARRTSGAGGRCRPLSRATRVWWSSGEDASAEPISSSPRSASTSCHCQTRCSRATRSSRPGPRSPGFGTDAESVRRAVTEVAELPLVLSVAGSAAAVADLGAVAADRFVFSSAVEVTSVERRDVAFVLAEVEIPDA